MVRVAKDDVKKVQSDWDTPIRFDEDEEPIDIDPATKLVHENSEIVKNTKQAPVPSKEFTGVDESITQICANISNQIYDAKSKDYFKLETDDGSVNAEVIIFDNHGELDIAIPAFVVAATQDTLIMGWRGTNKVMDFVTDTALAPVVSTELGKAATGVRIHSMMSAFIGSDLRVHQDAIISYMKKHRITNIVFTGHSLGGGLASTAHLFVQAQVGGYNPTSVWTSLTHTPTLHSVTFAAVMSVLDPDEVEDDFDHDNKLIAEVGKNTANFIFASDPVPRGYAHVQYIRDVIGSAAPEGIREANPIWFGLGSGRITESVLDAMRSILTPLIPVAIKYRHTGRLLYYADDKATEPLVLTDTGPAGLEPSKDKTHLNHHTYDSYNIRNRDHIQTALKCHSYFPTAFASYLSVEKEDSK